MKVIEKKEQAQLEDVVAIELNARVDPAEFHVESGETRLIALSQKVQFLRYPRIVCFNLGIYDRSLIELASSWTVVLQLKEYFSLSQILEALWMPAEKLFPWGPFAWKS
ncbi:unnamed protein product [Ilex paraguariensis]|uniref:Uncharacterized protein n=1 Tax=Ilex paraguariensis TaxID=185542 RepID=A0ABC8SPB0_9AQUA